ncbi:MAG: hypothetical protein AAF620_04585 [Bacteroidota bacterium]
MKILKSTLNKAVLDQGNTSENYWSWSMLLFFGILILGITSCKEDDDEINADGEDIESAILLGYLADTPEGEVYYMSAHEEMPNELDISKAVEAGTNVRIRVFGEYAYTFDPDALTVTKWSIDKKTLEFSVIGVLSYASTGITLEYTNVFASETQSFLSDLAEGLIMEWDPSMMSITKVHTVTSHKYAGLENVEARQSRGYLLNGNPVWPINVRHEWPYCCDRIITEPGAMVGVFHSATEELTYYTDRRIYANDHTFVLDEEGSMYLQSNRSSSTINRYFNDGEGSDQAHYGLLKLTSDGEIDADFFINFEDLFPIENYQRAGGVINNKLVMFYQESVNWGGSYETWWENEFGENSTPSPTKVVSIDLNTMEVNDLSDLVEYSYLWYINTIDNINYYESTDDLGNSFVLRQNSVDNYTVVLNSGDLYVERYHKLW